MSGKVASLSSGLPFFHGITIIVSGRLPSVRSIPDGSSLEEMHAVVRAHCMLLLVTMMVMSPFTLHTTEPMCGQMVHIRPTVLTRVGETSIVLLDILYSYTVA